ncbi:tyrosine-type recombinase/integrase [Sporolactobacillus pectinivorans]|uniref:tyrosine-type recombinase/integrase n=1 Tax=Sporolactobacillus pectinivorans TaxID=1591408 RepID=UPI000C25EA74|nr:tyrosine-type recombinase/integrase [Sporolactobacillus pectinivorans]
MNNQVQNIHNIGWHFSHEYDDMVLHGITSNNVFEHIKRINKLPVVSSDIYFTDEIWDFHSAALESVPKRKSTFIFTDVDTNFKEKTKFYVLTKMWVDKDKIQTIYVFFSNIKRFINYLVSKEIYNLEYLSLSTIIDFFETINMLAPNTIQRYKVAIQDFYVFYSSNYGRLDWKEINAFLSKADSHALKAQRKNNKWDTIPNDYFDRLLSCLVNVMNNKKAAVNDRGIAAMTILLSQTGLRNGEIRDIPANSLESIQILDGTKTAYHLRYHTSKGVRGNGNYKEVYTVMTELACKAYTVLEKLYAKRRAEIGTDLLFVPLKARTLPVTENVLFTMLKRLCVIHGQEIGCINVREKYPTLYHCAMKTYMNRGLCSRIYLQHYKPTDTISVPRPHQFRVKLCNELVSQGVSIYYIQRHMNHLRKEITYSYFRQEHEGNQDRIFAESVMKMLVTGETQILGQSKDLLLLRINDFIKKSKLNVATNLEEIITKLTKEIPIRAKNGGICIKSGPIRECNKNDETDNFYCAFGMCPNLFHSFFMVDINYEKYKTLIQTIKYNHEKGFIKAAEKETEKLKWIAKKFLIPELEELNAEINHKGEVTIKKKFPQTSFFVDNYDHVYSEVKSWLI